MNKDIQKDRIETIWENISIPLIGSIVIILVALYLIILSCCIYLSYSFDFIIRITIFCWIILAIMGIIILMVLPFAYGRNDRIKRLLDYISLKESFDPDMIIVHCDAETKNELMKLLFKRLLEIEKSLHDKRDKIIKNSAIILVVFFTVIGIIGYNTTETHNKNLWLLIMLPILYIIIVPMILFDISEYFYASHYSTLLEKKLNSIVEKPNNQKKSNIPLSLGNSEINKKNNPLPRNIFDYNNYINARIYQEAIDSFIFTFILVSGIISALFFSLSLAYGLKHLIKTFSLMEYQGIGLIFIIVGIVISMIYSLLLLRLYEIGRHRARQIHDSNWKSINEV